MIFDSWVNSLPFSGTLVPDNVQKSLFGDFCHVTFSFRPTSTSA